jgi:hypothetical protein
MPLRLRDLVATEALATALAAIALSGAHVSTIARAQGHVPAAPPSQTAVCRQIRALTGIRGLAARRRGLKLLATGDSMIYPVSQELAAGRVRGEHVVADRHDGTGLTTDTISWPLLAAEQAARVRPDVTVVALGGRDGGVPIRNAHRHIVSCCGPDWIGLYAGLVRPLVRSYLRHGQGRVYWLTLPVPREDARAPLFAAVNDAVRSLVPHFGSGLRMIGVDTAVSPGGFQDTISYDGLTIHPRTPDGIHLTHAGACVEESLVSQALREDGLLR